MFTSRAEERLAFRHDNADQRLTPKAQAVGLISAQRYAEYEDKMRRITELKRVVSETRVDGELIAQLLKRPTFSITTLPSEIRLLADAEVWELVETDLRYEGYIRRQTEQNRKLARDETRGIPQHLVYASIPGLRAETRQKLAAMRPSNFAQAGRISGITPTDLSIISIWLSKK